MKSIVIVAALVISAQAVLVERSNQDKLYLEIEALNRNSDGGEADKTYTVVSPSSSLENKNREFLTQKESEEL
jgi:hypothetical protein